MTANSSVPLTILIIRHAEKQGEQWPGPGLTAEGVEDKKSLVVRGWQRAGAWATLFGTDLGGDRYPTPIVIYAANPDSSPLEQPSRRPFQTVTPLSERLGIRPIIDYQLGQESELASAIAGNSGVVLVSWEHKAITGRLLPAIASGQQIKGMPHKWDDTRYDLVLRFDRLSPEAPWLFWQLCPRLLSGDSPAVME